MRPAGENRPTHVLRLPALSRPGCFLKRPAAIWEAQAGERSRLNAFEVEYEPVSDENPKPSPKRWTCGS